MIAETLKKELMFQLQQGIPLVPDCYTHMGAALGIEAGDIIDAINDLFEDGSARRLGGLFDLRRLGYTSALCGATVPSGSLDEVAARLVPYPGITHCYSRRCADGFDPVSRGLGDLVIPNLWFTLSSPADNFNIEWEKIIDLCAPHPVTAFPALQHFKISVILDPRSGDEKSRPGAAAPVSAPPPDWDGMAAPYSEQEKSLVRRLAEFPLIPTPFEQVAQETGYAVDDLLALLTDWKSRGILKRIGLILKHRKVGFSGNGMCTWRVPASDITAQGAALAKRSEVTHCYERETVPNFPFNLYAMIHAREVAAMLELAEEITEQLGLDRGLVLVSDKEYKKTSLKLFAETGA